MDQQRIEIEWAAALQDAELDASRARVYVFPGDASPSGSGAIWGQPGENLNRKQFPFPDDNAGFRRMNTEDRDLHRIAVWGDQRAVLLAAKMRHELEHARQFEAHGHGLFLLHTLMNAILDVKVHGLAGGGFVYSSIPMEVDANAAAARFAHDRYAADAAALLDERHEDSVLLRSLCGPGRLETLPARMICFAYEYGDIGEEWVRRQPGWSMDYVATLENMWPGASRI